MPVDRVTIFSLSADVILAVFGAALVFLVLWQDVKRRSNQYFALCMTIFSLYGVLNLPLQTARHFDLDPVLLVHALALLYVTGVVLLLNFVFAFADLPRHLLWHQRLVGVPMVLLFAYLAARELIFTDFKPAGSMYDYHMTPGGYAGAAFMAVYVGWTIALLLRERTSKTREIAAPMLILALGLVAFSATPGLREYSLNTGAVILTVFLMGRVVIKYQVFKPLEDVNQRLQQKNEELDQATRAKAQFLANMSHELRTPLNSIIGYTNLVSAGTYGDLMPDQRDRLYKVSRNGHVLLNLINDVLDLSKLEAGRVELRPEQVDTCDMLDSLLEAHQADARQKGLSLVRAYSALPPLHVDEARVRQILGYLLANAIKFTETGAVILRGYADPAREQIVISVTDTGPGIAPEDYNRVFDLFHQTDGAPIRDHEGTGLGLAIARRLTELHGGRLWFESVVEQGTTFHVALPTARSAALARTPEIQPYRRSSGPLILAIDDDYEALELLQEWLETAHYRVFGVRTVNAALQMTRVLEPALITLDVQLPDTDGWDVLDTLRHDPATAETPVLIISSADIADRARKADTDGFLAKPVDFDMLLRQVRRLVPHDAADAQPAGGPPGAMAGDHLSDQHPEVVS